MMKDAIVTVVLAVGIFAAFIIQTFIPPMNFAAGARVMLVPVLFCAGACTLPYPLMLALATLTGLMTDLLALQVVGASVEISVGWSILLLVALGSICQGVRPLVLRGQWWLPALMSAFTTLAILLSQYLAITMRRFDTGGLIWNETVTARILVPALVAMILSLWLHMIVAFVAWRRSERRLLRDF